MQSPETPRNVADKANELYWSSDLSVNQIAEDLDLSKGMLYGLIEPEATGRACPECGSAAVWAHRTAKAKGTVSCASCSWEGRAAETHEPGADGIVPLRPRAAQPSEDATEPSGWSATELRTAAGGALLGAAAGLALILWARRR